MGRTVGNPGEGRGEAGEVRQGGQWGEPRSLPRISVELRQTIIQIGSGRSETLTNRINHILGSSTPSSHARSCGCGDMGGRMCVMVAQHS